MENELQYPHHLWESDGGGGWDYVGICREETAGWDPNYNPISMFARHNSVIMVPAGTKTIPEGTMVRLTDDAAGTDERVHGLVYKYDRGRLHNRLWI